MIYAYKKIFEVGEIECVVSTICNFMVEHMVSLGNLKITALSSNYRKRKPDNGFIRRFKTNVSLHYCFNMYTFIVNDRSPVIIEDYIFATFWS